MSKIFTSRGLIFEDFIETITIKHTDAVSSSVLTPDNKIIRSHQNVNECIMYQMYQMYQSIRVSEFSEYGSFYET